MGLPGFIGTSGFNIWNLTAKHRAFLAFRRVAQTWRDIGTIHAGKASLAQLELTMAISAHLLKSRGLGNLPNSPEKGSRVNSYPNFGMAFAQIRELGAALLGTSKNLGALETTRSTAQV